MFPCSPCVRVLVAQSLNPTVFPLPSRPTANLAGIEGLLLGGFDTLANCVIRIIDEYSQPAEFLVHLQDFTLMFSCPLKFGDPWFQVLARRHTISKQPSSCWKPRDISVWRTSPLGLNHWGQRSNNFCFNSPRISKGSTINVLSGRPDLHDQLSSIRHFA
jgi:hypothetical protein